MSDVAGDDPDADHAAYLEAVEQMRVRQVGGDTWSAPAVFWTAVRYGVGLQADGWPAAAGRWRRLYAIAQAEHLPAVPARRPPASIPGRRTSQDAGRSRVAELKSLIGKKGDQ